MPNILIISSHFSKIPLFQLSNAITVLSKSANCSVFLYRTDAKSKIIVL